jgi:prepilin peptidase CpaA
MILSYIFVALVGVYTLTAAVLDFRLHRIPNYLTVPTALAGLAFHMLAPSGWGALTSLTGFGVGFALLIVPWLLGGSGMGDVKLLAALGAWLGPRLVLIAFAVSIGAAALIAVCVLSYVAATSGLAQSQRRFLKSRRETTVAAARPLRVLPFAVPVAMSTWLVLVWVLSRGSF